MFLGSRHNVKFTPEGFQRLARLKCILAAKHPDGYMPATSEAIDWLLSSVPFDQLEASLLITQAQTSNGGSNDEG